ncbi:M1 family peptidase [Sphingomonas gilva]|uniref:Aminopeptidase N n=2 Tax=Sphingomonas gilva TaxID=2305907 RepID=A0A396RP96_9SPHN|nr:M1 family metallopeptidase [Sphingomonas gilva]RHW17052.1 M1 family peptidase [Sphingomonas gilva]
MGMLAAASIACAIPATAADPGKPPLTPQTAKSGGKLDADQAKLQFDTADLAFEIFPDREAISGIATLNFTAKAATDRLVIDLDRNLPVTAIAIDGRDLPKTAWSNPQGQLTIRLPRRISAGGKVSARITYGGTPHVAIRAPWDGGFVWAKTPQGAPWIATAVQGAGCDLFWPCIDHPTAEPKRIDLHITVPDGLKAISNGRLLRTDPLPDGRSTWHWSVANPTNYGIALNIAPYEVIRGTYQSRFGNSFPMEYWHLPGREAKARGLFAEFAPTLDFFEATVGPYPFAGDKMGVVETPHLGMEHQTINAYGNEYKKDATGFDWLFQHEFAHEWFANQLTAADWDDFWLHEGYGAYMQPLYGRWREGEARYASMMEKSRNTIANAAPLVSGKPMAAEDVYRIEDGGPGQDIYVKGAWMLHTLRNLIGDAAFIEVTTRAVYGRPDPKPGNFEPRFSSSAEYRAIVDQVTGSDYGWFFDVYLDEAALPELVETRRGNTLSLAWKTPENKPFPMPVEVQVDGRVQRLAMTGGKDTLTVPEGAHVVVDPWAKILKRSKAVEDYQAWQEAQAGK